MTLAGTRSRRAGLTLIEILVTLVIAAFSGAVLIQAMLAQGRSSASNEAWRIARTVSRGSLNRLIADLRVAEAEGALEAATADGLSITVRVPYGMGIACNDVAPLHVSFLPVDPAPWGVARYRGFAWRGDAGGYSYQAAAAPGPQPPAGTPAICTADSITTVPGGQVLRLSPSGGSLTTTGASGSPYVGMTVMLYQRVRYRFENSTVTALAGRRALTREVLDGGTKEELAAPFDSTARFRFIVLGATNAQDAPPGSLSTVRGIEVRLDGMSEQVPHGSPSHKRLPVTTAVYFRNRRD